MIAVSAVVVVLAAVSALVLVVVAFAARRRPSGDHGVESFRRHIDALSPEAREQMKKHARPVEPPTDGEQETR